MQRAIKIALSLSLMAYGSASHGAHWFNIGGNTAGDEWFLDVDSLDDRDGRFFVWVKIESPKKKGQKFPRTFKSRMSIHCKRATSITYQIISYDQAGSVEKSITNPLPRESDIVPESMTDRLRSVVCMAD